MQTVVIGQLKSRAGTSRAISLDEASELIQAVDPERTSPATPVHAKVIEAGLDHDGQTRPLIRPSPPQGAQGVHER